MASYHGKDAEAQIGGTAIGGIREFTYTPSAELADDTAKGDASRSRKAGLLDGTTVLNIVYDPGDVTQELLIEGASVSLELYPEDGSTVGNQSFTGTALVESVAYGSPLDNIETRDVTLQGYLTRGVAA